MTHMIVATVWVQGLTKTLVEVREGPWSWLKETSAVSLYRMRPAVACVKVQYLTNPTLHPSPFPKTF